MTIVTHFQLFWKRPRASKNAPKWTPEWNLWALKITKIHHIQNSKKQSNHKTVRAGYCVPLGGSAKVLFSIKTHIHLRNPENKCPGPRNDCLGLKIDPQAFKITAHLGVETPRRSTPRAQRNGTVPGYARSALDIFILCLHNIILFVKIICLFSRNQKFMPLPVRSHLS